MIRNPSPKYIQGVLKEIRSSDIEQTQDKSDFELIQEWLVMEFGGRFMDLTLTEDDVK